MLSDTFDAKTKQIVCTQTGGAIATLFFYPIDTIRFRSMSHDNTNARLHNNSARYRGIIQPARLIIQHEGPLALYRGVGVAVGGATCSWGIYMYLYRTLQQQLHHFSGWMPNFASDVVLSTVASLGNAYFTTPIWHVKTRMQLEDTTTSMRKSTNSTHPPRHAGGGGGDSGTAPRRYSRFSTSLLSVIKSDGFFGLWRGFSPQLMMSAVNGVYFPVYQRCLEFVSTSHRRIAPNQTPAAPVPSACGGGGGGKTLPPSPFDVAVASGGAKTIISMMSNPFFVIRTKLQDERHSLVQSVAYKNLLQTAAVIWRQEGVTGFFRGMRAGVVVAAPKSMLTMVIAEQLYHTVKTM